MDLYVDNIDQLLQARSEIDDELRRHKARVTIFFTDVVGSTRYFDHFGDTAGLVLVQRHDNLVTRAVEEFQGTVVKTIGDSVMAEFPEPALAVRAAISIQLRLVEQNQKATEDERLHIRTGIHCGVGYRRGNDLLGDAVNVAARITKHGGPGQILITDTVREALAETELCCKSLGKVSLDGKSAAEELHEVVWRYAASDASDSSDQDLWTSLRAAGGSNRGSHSGRNSLSTKTPALSDEVCALLSNHSVGGQFDVPDLPRYQIMAQLGSGGMGLVFKALDRETEEIVALKILKPEIADQPSLVEAFKNELRLARKITHRNVCRIHDFNRVDGVAFISMEFVEGESLRCVLNRFNALSIRSGIKVARQICEGLREAHAQGIVHRDLKPENLMIDSSGNVKLMDFGLAHLAADGATSGEGTPSYMAPEQAQGAPVDQRCDIYALGLVMFEMFTGSAVFTGESPMLVALKQVRDTPTNPRALERTIPDNISKAILRCLEKDPAKRFQSVEELEKEMFDRSYAQKSPSEVWREMPRPAVALAAAFAVLIVAGFILFGRGATIMPDISTPSDAEFAAFHMAESIGTEEAWNAFLRNHVKGELVSVARLRLSDLRNQADRISKSTDQNPGMASLAAASIAANTVTGSIAVSNSEGVALRSRWSSLVDTVLIPGGVFMMGSDERKGDEAPRHQVRLDGFRMSRAEITNRQYFTFLEDTGYPRPRDPSFATNYLMGYPNLPVVNVSYDDAVAFCKWASAKFGMAVRLPTEAEWEYAAQAGNSGQIYPWGSLGARFRARYRDNITRDIPPVSRDSFPPNGFGLFNMNGNVSEWVADFYSKDYYHVSPVINPTGPATGIKRVVRGGNWAEDETQLATPRRSSRNPKDHSDQVGFRVVVDSRSKPKLP